MADAAVPRLHPNVKDKAGKRYGRLTVLRYSHSQPSGLSHWLCLCDCGQETVVGASNLASGKTRSCGCLHRETSSINGKNRSKHGICYTKLYRLHTSIKSRCHCESSRKFPDYGGRGITICGEWRDDVTVFVNWALANGYKEGLQIDRRNNDEGYSPENCRFVTPIVNANNKRNNRKITFMGKEHTLEEWSRITGIDQRTILYRLNRGYSAEAALNPIIRGRENTDHLCRTGRALALDVGDR